MISRCEVRMTTTMGRGLFAREPIAAGENLGTFHTIRIPPDEVKALQGGTLSRFWFEDEADGSAFIVLGDIELVNHSRTPNCERRWYQEACGELVEFYALRDIAADEQLTMDYEFDGTPDDPEWA